MIMGDDINLEVVIEQLESGTVVRPMGEIDLSRSPCLRVELAQIQRLNPKRLIIDLASVPYMDSSGVATLVEALQIARKQCGNIVLCNLQDRVRSIFEIARLDMVFNIVSNLDDAAIA